jgi:hypothetical protein
LKLSLGTSGSCDWSETGVAAGVDVETGVEANDSSTETRTKTGGDKPKMGIRFLGPYSFSSSVVRILFGHRSAPVHWISQLERRSSMVYLSKSIKRAIRKRKKKKKMAVVSLIVWYVFDDDVVDVGLV